MTREIIGGNVEKEEIPIEFRVKLDRGRSMADLIEELKMGGTVQFVATKNLDLWLSDMGHDKLLARNGIQHEDVETTGAAWMEGDVLEIQYRDPASDEVRRAIRKELELLI